jgi:hypothetical protein
MMRLVSLDKIESCYNEMLCYDVKISSTLTIPQCTILNEKYIGILKDFSELFNSKYVIVSSERSIKRKDLNDFVIHNICLCLEENMKDINKQYGNIFDDGMIYDNIYSFIKNSLKSLDSEYLLALVTTPLILNKSLKLAILSMYFSLKIKLTLREIGDVVNACLLSDINICMNNIGLMSLADDDFFLRFKTQRTSYNIVEEDKNLSINTKRLIKYWKTQNTDSVYTSDDGKIVFRDPTMEVVQVSNELLQYDANMGHLRNVYNQYSYSIFRPVLVSMIKHIENDKEQVEEKTETIIEKLQSNFKSLLNKLPKYPI